MIVADLDLAEREIKKIPGIDPDNMEAVHVAVRVGSLTLVIDGGARHKYISRFVAKRMKLLVEETIDNQRFKTSLEDKYTCKEASKYRELGCHETTFS